MMGRSPYKKLLEKDTVEDVAIVDQALARVGIENLKERSYTTLSGGEKQRVVLARAIAQTPSFIILDEPTNHLDIKHQLQIMSAVKDLKIGVLAAMHDLALAATYCDYIYLLKEGQAVACGTPDEVITEDNIEAVYEVKCKIYPNPIDGRLAITYLV